MALLIIALVPRTSFAENLRVVVPRAQRPLFPDEIIPHAEPAASGALHEDAAGAKESIGQILRKILEIEHVALVEVSRQRGTPADSSEQLEIAHRSYESVLVFGRKRAVDPIEEACQRQRCVLRLLADYEPERRPGKRYQTKRDFAVFARAQRRNDGQRVGIGTDDEDLRFIARFYEAIEAGALR